MARARDEDYERFRVMMRHNVSYHDYLNARQDPAYMDYILNNGFVTYNSFLIISSRNSNPESDLTDRQFNAMIEPQFSKFYYVKMYERAIQIDRDNHQETTSINDFIKKISVGKSPKEINDIKEQFRAYIDAINADMMRRRYEKDNDKNKNNNNKDQKGKGYIHNITGKVVMFI